ncbi:phosphatase PAP2 family protein [Dactylosporangium sp. NPDC000555]|uniref:phosphatase PAP2 family protein n=1 Tax=Dactylosporangium sp. NPDC000555 TaxID=3154260 RepID=UPI00332037E0
MRRLDGSAAGEDEADGMTIPWEAPSRPRRAAGTAPQAGAADPMRTGSAGTGRAGRRTPSAPVSLARQAGIGLAAVVGYLLVRGAVGVDDGRALDNARAVAGLERSAGLPREDWLRERLAANSFVTGVFEWLYTYGHWLVAGAVLVWLARRHPEIYYRARDAMLLTAAAALFVFVVFPVAPPGPAGEFASLPSLHAGWDLVVGLAVAAAAGRAWARAAGAGLAALMAASVVLTGHHYLVDVLAGAAITGACWLYLRARRRPAALRGYAGWDGLDLR